MMYLCGMKNIRYMGRRSATNNDVTCDTGRCNLLHIVVLLLAFVYAASQQLFAMPKDTLLDVSTDSLPKAYRYDIKEAFYNDFSHISLEFIASGFLIKSRKKDFREMRHYFQPTFKTTWDNYTQYTPLAATWALNIAGVEGRSSLKRLAVSNALSALTMAAMVNSLKYSTREQRPDATSHNSFPSGHTATSFMAATILHKEYGLTRSLWYSFAGYSVAAATGVCRILNNRHWISDVLVGAGIGIISTDVGYLLTDLIYKDKGLKRRNREEPFGSLSKRPSFLSLSVEMGAGPKVLETPEVYDNYDENLKPYAAGDPRGESHPLGLKMYMGTSSAINVEGIYFPHKYFGIGGRVRAISIPVTATTDLSQGFRYDISKDGKIDDEWNKYFRFVGIESSHIGMFDFSAGGYFSFPLNNKFCLGSKLLVGNRFTTDYKIDAIVDVDVKGLKTFYAALDPNDKNYFDKPDDKKAVLEYIDSYGDGKGVHESEFLTIKLNHAFIYSTGLSLSWAYKPGMLLKAQINYDYSQPEYTYELINRWQDNGDGMQTYLVDTFKQSTNMHNLSLGLGMAINF